MVWTYLTSRLTFDLAGHGDGPRREGRDDDERLPWSPGPVTADADAPVDVYWCTADCGWITGHSYIVYGLLPNRVPTLMYEGAPTSPRRDRFWDIVQRHAVTKFYTAPTAIRAFMKWGDEHVEKHDLSSLKVLGTVGEPINPEAWIWYQEKIGGGTCPVVDTWWQTETGGHMLDAAARRHHHRARLLRPADARRVRLDRAGRRATRRRERGRPAGDRQALARDAPRHPRRPAALPRHLLVGRRRQVLPRRRRPPRRERQLLDHGPHRRRDRRRRPQPGHDGGRDRRWSPTPPSPRPPSSASRTTSRATASPPSSSPTATCPSRAATPRPRCRKS